MTTARKHWRCALVARSLPLSTVAAACSAAEDDGAAQAAQGAEESRSAESTESGEAVTKPQRIASLSSDATSVLAELVDHERIVASPATPGGKPVGGTALPDGVHADPEQVLALNPDLVVLTERHGSEGSAADLLANSGVKVRSEEHTSELQSRFDIVCRLLLEKKSSSNKRLPQSCHDCR